MTDRQEAVRHTVVDTRIGPLTLVASGEAIAGVYFPHHWHLPAAETFGERVALPDDPLLAEAARQLVEYLDGSRREFDLPTTTAGDAFQERVWALLRETRYGETTSYGALAERLGDKALAQRVGQAVGRNPLSLIVACHRVVGTDGTLTGYAGGLKRKQFLLELEEPTEVKAGRLF